LLRTEIIEKTYGPGLAWHFKSASEADRAMQLAAETYQGKLGVPLEIAQRALRSAMTEMVELRRIRGLAKRKKADEARLTRSISQWLDLCDVAQRIHEVEAGMRDAGYDIGPADVESKRVVQEQYQHHVEATAARRAALMNH
jgi:hypothetical protein